MKLQSLVFVTIFLSVFFAANAQTNDGDIRLLVLKKSIVNRRFIFGKWTEDGQTETHLTYLGKLKTKTGHTYKIMTSVWFWGQSRRATSRILIFNGRDQYVGNYYLPLVSDLPSALKNGKLYFRNTDKDCDTTHTTIVDVTHGLPKQFFSIWRNNSGDFFSFEPG